MDPRPGTETSRASPSPDVGGPAGALCVRDATEGERSRVRQRPNLDFRRIFDSEAPAVSRTLRYLGVPDSDLMDAAQEVFLVVNRRFGEFEGRSTLATWIRQICLRVALTYRRSRGRRREDILEEPPEPVVGPDQQTDLERREQRALLNGLLDTLDDDQRAVLVLYEIELLPMREVAETVGCPLQTAYSRRKAALERLRMALNEVEGTP
jgi:RNA polymerase sigma-70 factor (ECF subfamily)